MTIHDALRSDIHLVDGEILLAHLLQKPKTWIVAHPEYMLREKEEKDFSAMVKRRSVGEPIAYITGEKEFYGRLFSVNASVLIPRPATEGLVACALDMIRTGEGKTAVIDSGIIAWMQWINTTHEVACVVDIGTGSGCIAVTIACEEPSMHVIATDISETALTVARHNAKRHHAEHIEYRQGHSLDPLHNLAEPFLLVSNPPYIRTDALLAHDVVNFEPHAALFAGEEGMDVLLPLLEQAKKHPYCHGILFECTIEQGRQLDALSPP